MARIFYQKRLIDPREGPYKKKLYMQIHYDESDEHDVPIRKNIKLVKNRNGRILMAKIKGWTRIFPANGIAEWKGDDGDRVIVGLHPSGEGYITGANGMLHVKSSQTKQEALDYA